MALNVPTTGTTDEKVTTASDNVTVIIGPQRRQEARRDGVENGVQKRICL
jgi:hypothetical protein